MKNNKKATNDQINMIYHEINELVMLYKLTGQNIDERIEKIEKKIKYYNIEIPKTDLEYLNSFKTKTD